MGATNPQFPGLVPPMAAPEPVEYAKFIEQEVPVGSGASRALIGTIQPFADDQTAKQVLRTIERDEALIVCDGRLSSTSSLPKHSAEEFLLDMAVECKVLILEFEGSEHRRAFLLDPKLLPRFSQNPHIRVDKSIRIDGQMFPALCVYSGNLFHYDSETHHLIQFLDQTATYLAKHLIWLRTRILLRRVTSGSPQIVQRRKPTDPITYADLLLSAGLYWEGYWPGIWAPAGAEQHLKTVDPKGECWCWSGKSYAACHRNIDRNLVRTMQTF